MKAAILIAAFGALMQLCGCMTYRKCDAWSDVKIDGGAVPYATVQIENSGWYLFDFIPLFCGDPERPNDNTCRIFKHTVTLQNNLVVLDWIMAENNCTVISNLASRETDDIYFIFLLYRRACHTTAVISREEDQT